MKKRNQAIIFFDIDGTLCEYEAVPSRRLQEGFEKLRQNGHVTFLCTGRGNPDIPDEIWNLGFDGIISCMGAEIQIGDECIRHVFLEEKDLKETVELLVEHKIAALLLGAGEVLRTEFMAPVSRETGVVRSTEDLTRNGICVEIASIDSEYEDTDAFEKCRETILKHSEIVEYNEFTSQTQIRGIHKANAIQEILKRPEYQGMVSYAIGDSQNDIQMLQEVEIGIAMGQAPECVKKCAAHVTGTLEEDGVYQALLHYKLIE